MGENAAAPRLLDPQTGAIVWPVKPGSAGLLEDATGAPVTAYHGSRENISSFDPAKLGSNTKAGSAKEGFFFSSSPENSAYFAEIAKDRGAGDLMREWTSLKTAARRLDKSIGLQMSKDYNAKISPWSNNPNQWEEVIEKSELYSPRVLEKASERAAVSARIEEIKEALNFKNFDRLPGHSALGGQTIYPVNLRMNNPLEHDFAGAVRHGELAKLLRNAKKSGQDGVIARNSMYPGLADNCLGFDTAQLEVALYMK